MIKGSEKRQPGHPAERIFVDRWSPRAMSGEEVPGEDLPDELQAKETPNDRRPLTQSVCEGPYSL